MTHWKGDRLARWLRMVGPFVIAYCVAGLLVEAAVPHILPRNAFTTYVGNAAKAGVFAIWFYLIWRIAGAIQGIYGAQSARYLELTPIWRILLDVTAAFLLAACPSATPLPAVGAAHRSFPASASQVLRAHQPGQG